MLRRYSNSYGVVQRVTRLTRHLERQGRARALPLRPAYRPHKLSQRLSDETVAAVASTKVVCDGPGEQRALHVEAATDTADGTEEVPTQTTIPALSA
ncbi:hypothetical protein FHU33_1054 [Blastococcus colisei]|uniref:Uncharacterized protein n=1 Tax=Blastococcus colisei TaxID=1564162 RepID=A0A543PC61_9ACTN|nr:hypothetical protein [Blastococcus colisei]TQN41677.1 hypothetical protein FHU33_1054 [Blastococcus colisei]